MASITTDSGGSRRVIFANTEGRRKTVRLGKVSKREAETAKTHIEHLAAAMERQGAPPTGTSRWAGRQSREVQQRLAELGLITIRADDPDIGETIAELVDGFLAERECEVKPGTMVHMRHTRRNLVDHFGANKPIVSITTGDALAWRRYLLKQKLSENTVRRRTANAKLFFGDAVDREVLERNPFKHKKLPTAVQRVEDRQHFIDRDVAQKVLDACPDAQWRLLFALSRYGGLRCPSEHLALQWGDVMWEANKIRVPSPKTEHHPGGAYRVIPLFDELRGPLQAVYDELLEDFDPKRKRLSEQPVITRYRDPNANLRTQLLRIIKRAGVQPWPKLFHNLRSSRQTELEEQFPSHVVCSWIGNSEAVARKHYLQVTDDHFDRAAGIEPSTDSGDCHETPANVGESDDAHDAEHQPVQTVRAVQELGRNESHGVSGNAINPEECAHSAELATSIMGDEGLEQPHRMPGNRRIVFRAHQKCNHY